MRIIKKTKLNSSREKRYNGYYMGIKLVLIHLKMEEIIIIKCKKENKADLMNSHRSTLAAWAKKYERPFKIRITTQSETSFAIFKVKK